MKLFPRTLQALHRVLMTSPRPAKRNRIQLQVTELESRLTPSGGIATIVLSPATATLANKGQEQFTATAFDQSGDPLSPQPQFSWSLAGGGVGQINNSGDYKGPDSGTGTATVDASSGGVTGTASVTIEAMPPVITQQASSNQNPVTGTGTQLQVQASDPNGANLTYSWAVANQPSGAKTPSFNNANNNNTNVTFYQAGSYSFLVTVEDSLGLSSISNTTVTVAQTPSNNISITPANATLGQGTTTTFTASAVDQFGNAMQTQPNFTWQVNGGALSSTTGASVTFTAGNPGNGQVKVSDSSASALANITVTPTPATPVVTQAASAQSSTVTGTGAKLQVQATDPDGATPMYSWSVASEPSGATTPTFNNGTSSQTDTTFYQAGSYTFTVTIADALNPALTATSSVTVSVVQTPSNNLSLTPANVSLLGGQTRQFTVSAVDQFGNPITSSLTGSWQINGVGQINPSGLYSANGGAGTAQIKFSASTGANAQANITVNAPPAAPTNLQASVQNGQVNLQWNTNSNNQTGFVVQYLPCCIPNPQWTTLATVASNNNNYTFTPPANIGPTIEYQVYETNAAGNSPPSNAVTLTVPAAAPTGLSATAGNGQISLSWTASLGAASYDIYRATSSGKEGNTPFATGVTALTYPDGNVTGGTTYYYEVAAVDAAGQSPMSSEVSATPPQLPAAPTGLTATAGASNISLSWNAVSGATSYNIYRGTSSGGETFDLNVASTSYNDIGLTASTTYYYQVTAVNSIGEGAKSTEVSATPGNDWFTNNLPDLGLQDQARTDFNRDGSITYDDMLGLLNQAVTETGTGTVSTAVVESLQATCQFERGRVPQHAPLRAGLASSGRWRHNYLGTVAASHGQQHDGNPVAGPVNEWFLGEDLPAIDTQYEGTSGYVLANARHAVRQQRAPHSIPDVYQGEEGDCWLCASFAEIADKQPGIIQGSFTDDGLVTGKRRPVHVWTYSYFEGSTREYMTVNNYFPSDNGAFMYLDFGQTIANTSNVLWGPLMEKAYAGLYGDSYASLNGGLAQNVLPTETGGSSGGNLFNSESTYIAAIQSPTTLLTLASWSTNYGLRCRSRLCGRLRHGHRQQALFQLYNPWGFYEPGAVTWSQLTQGGDFTQDGDTVVSSAAPTVQTTTLSPTNVFGPNTGSALAFESPAPSSRDLTAYLDGIATPTTVGRKVVSDTTGALPDSGPHNQTRDDSAADLDNLT